MNLTLKYVYIHPYESLGTSQKGLCLETEGVHDSTSSVLIFVPQLIFELLLFPKLSGVACEIYKMVWEFRIDLRIGV